MFDFVPRFVGDVCPCVRSQSGPWCVATWYSPPHIHPTFKIACWSGWILRRIPSALFTVKRQCGSWRCVFTFHCFPSFSIFCHFDPCVVVLYFISFRLFSFLWRLEEVVYFIFPSLFWFSRRLGSILRLSLPVVCVVTMQFSLPIAISFFCAFQPSMWFLLFSFFPLRWLRFFLCIQSDLLLQFRLC